jgi:DNA-binding IclR family transcriptional regulator
MDNRAIEHYEQLAEERLLQALAWSTVLPYAELKARAAVGADDATFQRLLDELIARGLVQRKAARQSLWYIGYARARPANNAAQFDDLPAPFRQFLSELVW